MGMVVEHLFEEYYCLGMQSLTTDTRLRVLAFIASFMEEHRYAPTREEISEAVGLSNRSSVQYHVNGLTEEGFLDRVTQRHRMMHVTERGKRVLNAARETGVLDEQ